MILKQCDVMFHCKDQLSKSMSLNRFPFPAKLSIINEAKQTYIRICKSKSAVYHKDQTATFLQYKFTDPRKYWQHIKPRNGSVDIDVAPARFAEYFSQLYASNNSTFLNKLSEENYDVQNETLDRDLLYVRWKVQLII